MNKSILITVDVEDWFQVENFKSYIPFSDWPSYKLRVEKNVHKILDLFDSCSAENKNKIVATFFTLGWVAERLSGLVCEIHERGHEIASHGYNHKLCYNESMKSLTKDLSDSRKLLEDIIGNQVFGYRAPSFSINNDILKVIEDCGYHYDSSYNSFALHGRYGRVRLPNKKKKSIAVKLSNQFYELPISNLRIRNNVMPWGGGGYFRLIPFPIFKKGIQAILYNYDSYLFYIHPWELDPGQPQVTQASVLFKFRHYNNLHKTEQKLTALFSSFDKYSFINCHKYMELI